MTPEVKERIDQLRHGIVPEGYKRTKVGICPEDWVENVLGDIYTERKEPGNEGLPLLMVSIHSGVSDGEVGEKDLPKRVKRIEDKSQYKRAVVGDLVFNMMRAWQGAIGSVRTEGMVSPAYVVAKPNDMVDPLFMDYYMKTNRMVHTIHRQSYGVTDFRLRLYWESFAPIPCVLPPAREQKKIAEILTTQDKVIELERQKIEEIIKEKRFFLEKMFPKEGQTVPEIRFKEFTDPWEQRKLGEVGKCQLGIGFPDVEQGGKIGTPFFKVSDMNNYGNEQEMTCANNYVTDEQIVRKNWKPITEVPAVIFAKVGAAIMLNRKRLCRFPFLLDNNTMAYKFGEQWDTNFGKTLFEKIDLTELVQVGALPSYNATDVENLDIKMPADANEQKVIGEFFANLDNLITLHQRKLEEEKNKKKALMQLLLTGIVRV